MSRSVIPLAFLVATLLPISFAMASGTGVVDAEFNPSLVAKAALLFDARNGKVLFRKNENELRPVASTQKLLTALLVAEAGDLDRMVTIETLDTLAAPTKLYLKAGEKYSRRQLLHALLIRSANDVAVALARDHSGSVEAFSKKMNERIRRLGGKESIFLNPNGLPAEGQFSSAREIAIVARAAYFHPVLRQIMMLRSYRFERPGGKVTELGNTNRVLRTFPYCNGMKTGYTRASGHCLIASGTKDNRHVIAVVLGSNKASVWGDSQKLLEYGLSIASTTLPTSPSIKRQPVVELPYRPSANSGRPDPVSSTGETEG